MKVDIKDGKQTSELSFVGVNFKGNCSLSKRYEDYLTKSSLTSPSRLLSIHDDCVIIATRAEEGEDGGGDHLAPDPPGDPLAPPGDPLGTLDRLCSRNGFSRCSGRMFAGHYVTEGEQQFIEELQNILPQHSRVRVHCYPPVYTKRLLDTLDLQEKLQENDVMITPTNPSHLLVAVLIENSRVCWGLFTESEYRRSIARPGDGDRDHVFNINFNKAQAKVAEALQLLSGEENSFLFGSPLLVVDVGAAPGGWSAYLATKHNVSIIAVDPAELDPEVKTLSNLRHLRIKAEDVVKEIKAEDAVIELKAEDAVKELKAEDAVIELKAEDVVKDIKAMYIVKDLQASEMKKEEGSRDPGAFSPLEGAALDLCGADWRKKYRLLTCDANLDVRDSVRELVLPVCSALAPGGLVIVTLKLGRRVGEAGVRRKEEAVRELLKEAAFQKDSIRSVWLFSNSKNERTVIARKSES